ncbi:MAG: cobalamin biosynthesis protein CobQ [Pseudomonadota bacterium]
MNTPAHLLIGAAVVGRRQPRLIGWALLGALLPDLSLYVLGGVSLFLLRIPPQVVFDELYFSPAWQTVFAIDNSVIVWGIALALAVWARKTGAIALCTAALLHIALDFPLHAGDGRPHFWPVSAWVYDSPFSYWDRSHGAATFAPIEALFSALAAMWLWQVQGLVRWGAVALLSAELWVVRQWLFVFGQ